MLGYSARSRGGSVDEFDRRLRALEHRLTSVGGHLASALPAADRLGETIASALSSAADRLRYGAGSISGEAAKLGTEVAKVGDRALRRLSSEVEHRPLLVLAVAVGVGILIGLASQRRH
jgi:ElaB/YqjD/DUF883 family membrane-anchored ribosome-binding protein